MPSIFDIAPPKLATRFLSVDREGEGGAMVPIQIEVRGLTIYEMAALMRRFPVLAKKDTKELFIKGDIDPELLEQTTKETQAWLIAAIAIGVQVVDATEELVRERFSDSEILAIGSVIMEMTNPAERTIPLAGNGAALPQDEFGKVPVTN